MVLIKGDMQLFGESFEIRTVEICADKEKVLDFVQDEFIVSRQTAKKMILPNALLVYDLSNDEAEHYVEYYKNNGLICKIHEMKDDE